MLPFIQIGSLAIPTYGTCIVLAIAAAVFVAYPRLKKRHGDINDFIVVVAVTVVMAMLWAKLLYIFISYGVTQAVIDMIKGQVEGFMQGGLVFYGGLIGGVIGALVTMKLLRVNFNDYIESIAPVIPLAHGIGRIGCLMAGCCHGFPYDGALAVTSPYVPETTLFPIQGVEALLLFSLSGTMLLLGKRFKLSGVKLLCVYGIGYPIIRFTLEFFRGDLIRGIYGGLSTSQWISIGIATLCVGLLVYTAMHKADQQKA